MKCVGNTDPSRTMKSTFRRKKIELHCHAKYAAFYRVNVSDLRGPIKRIFLNLCMPVLCLHVVVDAEISSTLGACRGACRRACGGACVCSHTFCHAFVCCSDYFILAAAYCCCSVVNP